MKTIEELYNEILASDELKKELTEAGNTREDCQAFLEKYDCSATADEFAAYLKERTSEYRELNSEDLAAVTGGSDTDWDSVTTGGWVAIGAVSFCWFIACAMVALREAVVD